MSTPRCSSSWLTASPAWPAPSRPSRAPADTQPMTALDGRSAAGREPRRVDHEGGPMAATPTIDEQKLKQFMGSVRAGRRAAATAPLVVIGDKLGLYKAMADGDPLTPAELAERTGCHERYVREWLCQQAAGGYVEYDAATGTYPDRPSRRSRWPTTTARPSSPARSSCSRRSRTSRTSPSASAPARASLARARPRPVRGHRALLPPGLPREPRRVVAAVARRRRRKLRARARAWPTSAAGTAPRRS